MGERKGIFSMRTSVNLLSNMWDVGEQTNTNLGQEDSLELGMRLTWKKTKASYFSSW